MFGYGVINGTISGLDQNLYSTINSQDLQQSIEYYLMFPIIILAIVIFFVIKLAHGARQTTSEP